MPITELLAANAELNKNPLRGWSPVIDRSILPHQPFDPVAPAISANIPLIIGTNRDEATLFLVLADTGFSTLDEAGLQPIAVSILWHLRAICSPLSELTSGCGCTR